MLCCRGQKQKRVVEVGGVGGGGDVAERCYYVRVYKHWKRIIPVVAPTPIRLALSSTSASPMSTHVNPHIIEMV
jgi:hypothetical protein